MNKKQILGGITALFGGLFQGILAVLLVVVVLITIAQIAKADESIYAHPSHMVMEDYDYYTDSSSLLLDMFDVFDAYFEILYAVDCERNNEHILYALHMIAVKIQRSPEIGYIYKDTIQMLSDGLCEE